MEEMTIVPLIKVGQRKGGRGGGGGGGVVAYMHSYACSVHPHRLWTQE